MISSDLTVFRGDKEKDKMVFASHFDVGFISSLNMVYFSLIGLVEPMTIRGNRFGVVEDWSSPDKTDSQLSDHGHFFVFLRTIIPYRRM